MYTRKVLIAAMWKSSFWVVLEPWSINWPMSVSRAVMTPSKGA